MGSEIVFIFTPLCLAAIFLLGHLAASPHLRVPAFLCAVLSSLFSYKAVTVVPGYSFWTQAGFFSFAFLLAAIIVLPALLGFFMLANRRSAA
jgi:hypothetical protein